MRLDGGKACLAVAAMAAAVLAACSAPTPAPGSDVTTVRAALTAEVVVSVFDNTGAPQVDIEVMPYIDGWGFSSSGWTNAQGHVTFALEEGGAYKFGSPGFGAGFFFWSGPSGHCVPPSCAAATITRYPPVVVTVTDGSGNPEVDLQVAAVNASDVYENLAWTDDQGQATISVPAGGFYFESHVSSTFQTSGPPGHCQVPGCTAAAIAVRRVAVTVVDGGGVPQADQLVVTRDAGGQVAWDWTDASGVATVALPVGDFHFTVQIGQAIYFSGAPGHCQVGAGCTAAQVVVSGPITVTLVDGQGQPIADQTVIAQPAGSGFEIYEATNSAGHAMFTLDAGAWRFQASCGDEVFWSGNAGHCVVPSSCSAPTITMICGACVGQPNGTACNDANPCTQADTCQTGNCVGSSPIACSGDQCRDAGACDIQTGACVNPPKANGTACNDSNACTQTDTCQAGTCTGSNPIACTASDQCHAVGTCNPATGVCSNPAKPEGTTCNDGAVCSQGETCQAATCQAPAATFPVVLNLPVQGLGSLGLIQSFAIDVNASGTTVGWSSTNDWQHHAWQFTGTGPMVNLDAQLGLGAPSSAEAINDSGAIVGNRTQSDGAHAFRYGQAGLEDFGQWADGTYGYDGQHWFNDQSGYARGSYAADINNSGQFVGRFVAGGVVHGYRYTDGVGMEDVGSLGGTTLMLGISESGAAVGSSWSVAGSLASSHAVLYENSVVGLVDLNDLIDPLAGWTLVTASSINGDYVVGAGVRDEDGRSRAFRLHLYTGVVDDLSGGWHLTHPTKTTATGDVVGLGYLNTERQAAAWHTGFVYTDRLGFKNLDDIVAQGPGWSVRAARSINASGQIVGWGYGHPGGNALRMRLPPGQAAACTARNVCGGGDGDAICLYSDGVVETSPGHFVAVFGFDNASSTSVQPTVNEVRLDGSLVANPQPAPPAYLLPGTHAGAFMPTFDAGQTIAWTVNGETVTASASSPRLPAVPLTGGGTGVVIGGETIDLAASPQDAVTPRLDGICDIGSGQYLAVFGYDNLAPQNVKLAYGDADNVFTVGGVVPSDPSPVPPSWFLPGRHLGAFLPRFSSTQEVSWTVAGQTVTASAASPLLQCGPPAAGSNALVAVIGGETITLWRDTRAELEAAIVNPDPFNPGLTVGTLDGQLDVSNDGAATYHVPIWVPGAPLVPNLALDYNSRNDESFTGVGFRLTGFGEITRCRAAYAQDPPLRPESGINFTDTDHLCLDGRILIPTSGTPWTNLAEYRPDNDPFTRVKQFVTGSSSLFEVSRRDGTIETYGQTADSVAGVGPGGSPQLSWAINRRRDRSQNVVEYKYRVAAPPATEAIAERLPETVKFGARAGLPQPYMVAFSYESAGNRGGYLGGYALPETQRLTKIVTFGPTLTMGGRSPDRVYRIAYDRPSISGRSVISSIQQCDADSDVYQRRDVHAADDVHVGAGDAGVQVR